MDNDNLVLRQTNLGISRLIHDLDKVDFQLINNHLSKYKLSNIQALSIIYLFNNEEHEVVQRDLEKEFGVTNPTMTMSLKSMQKKGLIIKTQSQKDKRAHSILLTEMGKKLYPQCLATYTEIEATYQSILSKDEQQKFITIANKILHALK